MEFGLVLRAHQSKLSYLASALIVPIATITSDVPYALVLVRRVDHLAALGFVSFAGRLGLASISFALCLYVLNRQWL